MSDTDAQAYRVLVDHYEACLAEHGDTHRGVDWPDADDARVRYDVMLDMLDPALEAPTLLDLGCGAGHLLEHIRSLGRGSSVRYQGLDLSERFVHLCQQKFPGVPFTCQDILGAPEPSPAADYVIMNGVFTERRSMGFDEMWSFTQRMLLAAWRRTGHAMAFNVMSSHVDWERDDLFHLPVDTLLSFLTHRVSRHVVIRCDYGLYEYTCIVHRQPRR